ncbi:MAG: UvrD-helicase domain-containing protein [Chthoniobacterales bacterium]
MPLIVQRASAGSGKTEQLARRYLHLLFVRDAAGNHVDPATILAATFTREAAGEILARIFRLLSNACQDEKARSALADGIGFLLPSQQECQKLLRLLVEKIDCLSIGTIDSFFARQAHALALDLGLAPDWKIADPLVCGDLARAAVLELLEKYPAARSDWSILHHFTRQLSFVDKAAALLEPQRSLSRMRPLDVVIPDNRLLSKLASADEVQGAYGAQKPEHSGICDASSTGATQQFAAEGEFGKKSNKPPSYLTSDQTKEILKFLNSFEIPLTSKGKPDARWSGTIRKLQESFLQPLALKDILNLSTLFLKCLTHFSEQPTFNRIMIPLDFLEVFSPLAEASRYEQERLELLREEALFRLVKKYNELRGAISFCTGNYTFYEIEAALQPGENRLSREEIEFRMEACTEHLLLDEYQDTSQRQHDFLSPLSAEVLAKGGAVFVVGDVKQGIYGWRGGKRHLLAALEKEYEQHLVEAPALNESYRSSHAVLSAVNEVFGALKNPEVLSLMNGGEEFKSAAAQWSADFEAHTGAARVKRLRGRVMVHEVPTEGEDSDERMKDVIEKVVELVKQHQNEDPLREIAILVRRTKFISAVLRGLRQQKILASGEGGNPLTDTLANEALLSLLEWLEHPGHTAAYDLVKNSPLGNLLAAYFIPGGSHRLRALLSDCGIANFLRRWTSQSPFQEACSDYELARVEQLLAMADRFDASGGGAISDFVRRVRSERVESHLSSGLRVLTMHAAKGLEFETVLLIDLDADIFLNRGDEVRVKTTDDAKFFIQTNQELMVRQGREKFLHQINKEQWAEALSLLYVGMTRAASYLDLVVLGNYKRRSTKSMAAWLRAVGLSCHEVDGISWREMKAVKAEENLQSPPSFIDQKNSPLLFQGIKKLSKRSPSQEEENGFILLAQKIQGSTARERGQAIHVLLAGIIWKSEGLSSAQHQLLAENEELASVFEEAYFFKKWSTLGVMHLEVWRERNFAVVTKKQRELLTGTFDRVVIGRSLEGVPITAEIIDFKTDSLSLEEKKNREEFYQPQLEAYREALEKMMPQLLQMETRLVWVH